MNVYSLTNIFIPRIYFAPALTNFSTLLLPSVANIIGLPTSTIFSPMLLK